MILCMNERVDYKRVPAKIIHSLYEESNLPAHWHVNLEIVSVTSGEMSYLVDGNRRIVRAGECIVINSGSMHLRQSVSNEPEEWVTVVFSNEWVKECCPEVEGSIFDIACCPEKQKELYQIMETLANIYKERHGMGLEMDIDDGRTYEYLRISGYLHQILYLLMFYFKKSGQTEACPSVLRQSQRIQMSVAYIEEHYRENLSVSDMAERCKVTREYFSRSFKRYTGNTFLEYLNRVRLIMAFRQVVSSEVSVLDIAMDCGFSDLRAFVRSFRKDFGCTPTEYRKRLPEKSTHLYENNPKENG